MNPNSMFLESYADTFPSKLTKCSFLLKMIFCKKINTLKLFTNVHQRAD